MLIKILVEDGKKIVYGNQRFMKAKQMRQNRSLDLKYICLCCRVPPERIPFQLVFTALRCACTVLFALCASRPYRDDYIVECANCGLSDYAFYGADEGIVAYYKQQCCER